MTEATIVQFRSGPSTRVPRGTRLNDIYEIEEQIASGGMGEIYRGHVIETGDSVAIKMIKPEMAENEAVLGLFRKEASALHQLHHDAIVRYYVFTVDRKLNRPYLAMEFVEGRSLSELLRRRPLSFDEAQILRRRLAAGLEVAHSKGIVHRDIAPDNIILPQEDVNQLKIIDFGIARQTRLGQATIIGDGFAGKYNYVSPEQLGLYGGEVTNRSDIYSLGLVLAESLLGKAIDMSGSQADVIEKRRKVPDLSKIDKRIRPLLERMLQPKPQDRPASMTEVAAWGQAGFRSPGAKARSALPLVAAGLAVLLAAAGGGWLYLRQTTVETAPQASATAPAPATPPRPAAVAPAPSDEKRAERLADYVARIGDFVRYYDGDPCLLLRAGRITDRSASIEAFTGAAPAVGRFVSEFREVNGFAPDVSQRSLAPPQCELVTFVHRIDPEPESGLVAELARGTVAPGSAVEMTIRGVAGRHVELFAVSDDGVVRNLTRSLQRDGDALLFRARIDEADGKSRGPVLLISVITTKRLDAAVAAADRTATTALFATLAEEIERGQASARVIPTYVRFE